MDILADILPMEIVFVGGGFLLLAILGIVVSAVMGVCAMVRRRNTSLRHHSEPYDSTTEPPEVQS